MLKIGLLLLCCAVYMAQPFNNEDCEMCSGIGTYKCGEEGCECHVNYHGIYCNHHMESCPSSECKNQGTCIFDRGQFKCLCPDGFFGLRCEHAESEIGHVYEIDKELERNCETNHTACMPPVPEVICSTTDLDDCDEHGNVRPFKQCPYPHYCWARFKNSKCDWECNRPECLYDAFECSTSRTCPENCTLASGICSAECSLDYWAANESTSHRRPEYPGIIQIALDVSNKYWWDNKEEIVSKISEPLRTPLRYNVSNNEDLEKTKYSLENVISRGRRSISNKKELTVVELELAEEYCRHPEECANTLKSAGYILSAAPRSREVSGFDLSIVHGIKLVQEREPSSTKTLAGRDLFNNFLTRPSPLD